jgi:UDP-glucuronate decarboxylase
MPDDGRVVSNFIVQALRGDPITIYGDGSQTRSFCYVDDLVEGMIRLMESAEGETGPINLGNSVETTISALATRITALAGGGAEIDYRPLPMDDPLQRCPDITRAKSILDWSPSVALDDGLSKTVAYFRSIL